MNSYSVIEQSRYSHPAARRLRTQRPRGFTLVELLVVISIIGILTALILPAVQSARESGRRTGCLNNLRQLGMATQNHLKNQGVFPAAAAVYTKKGKVLNGPTDAQIKEGNQHNWPTALMPFLEEMALQRSYDFTVAWGHAKHEKTILQPIPIMLCPSVPHSAGDRVTPVTSGSNAETAAVTDYTVIAQVAPYYYDALGIPDPGAKSRLGAPDLTDRIKDAHVRDGLSKTLFIEEDGGRPTYYVAPMQLGPQTNNYAHKQDIRNGVALGGAWAQPDNAMWLAGTKYDGLSNGGACFMNCTNNNELWSFHPGGSNVVLADSATKFVAEDTSGIVFAAAVTRSGGETVGDLP